MKKFVLLTSLSLGLVFNVSAQSATDLVENGSFEDIIGKIKRAGSIDLSSGWVSPTKTAADIYSSIIRDDFGSPENVNGKEDPQDGSAYAGFTSFSYGDKLPRSYVSTKLKLPMHKGQTYCVKFYVSLAEGSKYGSNNIAANFSKKQYNINEDKSIMGKSSVMHVENPIFSGQFGWEEVCGTYIAEGGEKFLTIGNFSSNGETVSERMKKPTDFRGQQAIRAYYYLDNVSVELVDDEGECKCMTDVKEEESFVYAVSPVNPEGMTIQQIVKYTKVYFGYNSDEVTLNSEEHLDNIINVLKENPTVKVKMTVHADEDEALDKKAAGIENKRSEAVLKYLTENGVDAERVSVENVGDSNLANKSGSEIGKAKNRRVTFILM
ncbi:MAG: OmpA family protein [Crocinitomicaceae bacterium]